MRMQWELLENKVASKVFLLSLWGSPQDTAMQRCVSTQESTLVPITWYNCDVGYEVFKLGK